MASSNIDLKIFTISKVEEREKYNCVYVFGKDNVRMMTFPNKFRGTLKENAFFLCRGVSIGDTIRLYESSRVFQCGKFPVDTQKIESFVRPPTLTVDEILAKRNSTKQTVSVKGILRKISDIIESPNSKRRELLLESTEGSSRVVCKLWGDAADLPMPPPDSIMSANCLNITEWKGNVTLNSSMLTTLKEADDETSFEGEVEAAEILEKSSYIIVSEKTLKINNELLLKIFPNNTFLDNQIVKGKAKGMTVSEIKLMNPTKKAKKE